MIVEMMIEYEMYSFMDGFSGYNQIRIGHEDQEKTSFNFAQGTSIEM